MSKVKNGCRAVAFIVLFCMLFLRIQSLVTPNWDWPDFWGRTNKSINGFFNEGKDTLDAVWLGTSHTQCGVVPMHVYELSGMRTYNLATSGQPLLLSYHRLQSALSSQSPKVVFLDASGCFYSDISNGAVTRWLKTITSYPVDKVIEKIQMAWDMPPEDTQEDKLSQTASAVLPLLRFHSNYMLNERSYLDLHLDQPFPQKGYAITTKVKASSVDDDGTDEFSESEATDAKKMEKLSVKFEKNYDNLKKVLKLCRDNGCDMVMVKMPVVSKNEKVNARWSNEKHQIIQQWCDGEGLEFLDLNYLDVGIDWQMDSCDGGAHLNLRGAEKVSQFFTQWLEDHYSFEDNANQKTRETWDLQLRVYQKERETHYLQMCADMEAYMNTLGSGNYTVLCAASAPAKACWDDASQTQFSQLTGTDTDLYSTWQNSPKMTYACVFSQGKLIDEAMMKTGRARLKGEMPDGSRYEITCGGILSKEPASVVIDGVDLAVKGEGLYFVVYDNDMGCVVDSVVFDTSQEGIPSKHGFKYESRYRVKFIDYENKLLKSMAS